MNVIQIVQAAERYFVRINRDRDEGRGRGREDLPYYTVRKKMVLEAFGNNVTFQGATSYLQKLFAQHGYWVSICGRTGLSLYVSQQFVELPFDSYVDNRHKVDKLHMPEDHKKYPYRVKKIIHDKGRSK